MDEGKEITWEKKEEKPVKHFHYSVSRIRRLEMSQYAIDFINDFLMYGMNKLVDDLEESAIKRNSKIVNKTDVAKLLKEVG